jgi:hypothetical protein
MTELEQQLRRRLQERAEAGPDPTELREAVRDRLEAIDGGRRTTRPRHFLLVAATMVGLIAALGAALAWLASPSDSDGDIAQELGPIAIPVPVAVAGTPLESESFRTPFTVTVPDDVGFDVRIASDSAQAVELSLGSGGVDGETATLRFVSAPSLLTVESVVEDLTASLVHTRLLGVEDGAIGGYRSRIVRMESDLGMTLAGFKLGPGTFLSASGVDRRYDAHVVMTTGGVLVVWIDAPIDEIDEAAAAADVIVSTLRWHS